MKRDELSQLNRKEYERLMDARRRRQKRYRRFQLFSGLLVLTLLCATVVLVLTVFFKIENISVTGTAHYSEDQIIAASGIEVEENIFRIRSKDVEKALWSAYPYVEAVKIKRKLPNDVVIQVTEAQPAIAVENGNSFVYLSEGMRVLEAGASQPGDDLLLIRGIELKNAADGQVVSFDLEEGETEAQTLKQRTGSMQLSAVNIFIDYVHGENAMGFDLINVSDVYNIQLISEGRFIIEIGALSDLEYKLDLVEKVVMGELGPTEMGRIRMSGDAKVSFLAENTINEISRLRAGLPVSKDQDFFGQQQMVDEAPQEDDGEIIHRE